MGPLQNDGTLPDGPPRPRPTDTPCSVATGEVTTAARVGSPRTARAILLGGMLVSSVGDDLAAMALDLHAASIGSSGLLAALLIGQSAPPVLLGLTGGLLADRVLRWWMWPASLLAQGLVLAGLALTRSPVLLVLGVTLVAVIGALTGPVANKLLAHYTEDAARSGGHVATIMGLSQAVGVAAGGAGFALIGAPALLALDAATFIAFALLACTVATRGAIELERPGATGGALRGFRRLASDAAFGRVGLAVIVATIIGTSIEGVVGIFVLTAHAHLSPALVGIVVAGWGLGVMAAGALSGRVRGPAKALMPAAAVVMGAVYVSVAVLLPPAGVIVALFAIGGVANGIFNAQLVAVIIGTVPGPEQGRAWAAWRWITATCFLLGYLTGGALGAAHSIIGMTVSGLVAAAAGLIGLACFTTTKTPPSTTAA